MINKVIAMILSLGIMSSPLNLAEGMRSVGRELTARVPITSSEQQAVYEKYTTRTEMIDGYEVIWGVESPVSGDTYTTGWLDYEINNIDGTVQGVGSPVYISYNEETTIYIVYSPLEICRITRRHYNNYLYMFKSIGALGKAKISTEVMGDFVSEVTVKAGSLPQDGKHTDGYWYVLKNLVED